MLCARLHCVASIVQTNRRAALLGIIAAVVAALFYGCRHRGILSAARWECWTDALFVLGLSTSTHLHINGPRLMARLATWEL